MMFKRLLMVLIDDIRQSDERMRYVCVQTYVVCPPFWLFPGGTRNSGIICFCVLLQTIGQMVMVGPTTLKRMSE